MLATGSTGISISRRISDASERERLRAIGARLGSDDRAWIARTAAAGRDESELERDARGLLERWREVEALGSQVVPPRRLLAELDLPFRWLRDRLDGPGTRIVVGDLVLGGELERWLASAGLRAGVELVVDQGPDGPFASCGADRALREAVSRVVRLPSGGHVTIDPTEALTAVDVDTGRSVGSRNLEQTILSTNLEAARTIARQIRLRNLGGIVVIDFIDMTVAANRERVLNELRMAFASDPSPVEILPFTPFGLVQLTRKRTRPSLDEQLLADCPRCEGSGRLPAASAIGARALRALEARAADPIRTALVVRAAPVVADWLRREAAVALQALERRVSRSIVIRADERIGSDFVIEPPSSSTRNGHPPGG
ncbi:MAG: ribonuclease E/G [Deltaproteobacteria bacterium]|nr:ribonuclease E/G [Deltaproteobacteria bacterium]